MKQMHLALATALCVASTACGGSGSEIASAPPPPSGPIVLTSATVIARTALPATVATTAGTYDTIAWISDQAFDQNGQPGSKTSGIASPSPISITVDPVMPAFSVRGQFPDGAIQRTYIGTKRDARNGLVPDFYDNFGYHIEIRLDYSDATSGVQSRDITTFVTGHSTDSDPNTERLQTSANTFEKSSFGTGIGLRYVAYGAWDLSEFVDGATTRQTRGLSAEFVYGTRTAPADLPASGKASYRDAAEVLHLDADFGADTIAARLDYPAKFTKGCNCGDGMGGYEGDTVIVGIMAAGSSAINSLGDFVIPLTGNASTPVDENRLHDVIDPVAGAFTGTFFGPQADEVGGFAEITKANGEQLWGGVPFLLGRK